MYTFIQGNSYGPIPSLKGSELWAHPVFKMVIIMVLKWLFKDSEVEAHTRRP